jgi:uncharacterized glyoxalase superfamily protein PhnB
MPLKKLTPNLMVPDVARTTAYYLETLGFDFVMAMPDDADAPVFAWPVKEPLAFAMVKSGEVEIFLQSRKSLGGEIPLLAGQKTGGSFTLYIECDDLDVRYKKIAAAGPFLKDLHTTFYGMREFYIQDINGYILAFAQKA